MLIFWERGKTMKSAIIIAGATGDLAHRKLIPLSIIYIAKI